MSEINKDILAHKIYDKYCDAVGGVAFNGDPLPKADEFFNDPTKQRQAVAWREATREVYELMFNLAKNIGHPAYGQSTAATEAINQLRNAAFDYLEIPE